MQACPSHAHAGPRVLFCAHGDGGVALKRRKGAADGGQVSRARRDGEGAVPRDGCHHLDRGRRHCCSDPGGSLAALLAVDGKGGRPPRPHLPLTWADVAQAARADARALVDLRGMTHDSRRPSSRPAGRLVRCRGTTRGSTRPSAAPPSINTERVVKRSVRRSRSIIICRSLRILIIWRGRGLFRARVVIRLDSWRSGDTECETASTGLVSPQVIAIDCELLP